MRCGEDEDQESVEIIVNGKTLEKIPTFQYLVVNIDEKTNVIHRVGNETKVY